MKVALIVTQESDNVLEKLIKGLDCNPGYGQGIAVREEERAQGVYSLEFHRGEISDYLTAIRVINGMIIANRAQGLMEKMLRSKKISFKVYEGRRISKERLESKGLKINEPRCSPNLIYTP